MPLTDLAERKSVFLVAQAYMNCVHRRYQKFSRPNIREGKSSESARAFFLISVEREMKIDALMSEAFDLYSEDWCERTFHNPYPPIFIVIGPKTRAKLSNVVTKVKITKENRQLYVHKYLDILGSMPIKEAIKVVQAGWPEGPAWIRKELVRNLRA